MAAESSAAQALAPHTPALMAFPGVEALLAASDQALYKAKHQGRNRAVLA
ncbi:hypothetical protein [Hydrogenophaga atypica]